MRFPLVRITATSALLFTLVCAPLVKADQNDDQKAAKLAAEFTNALAESQKRQADPTRKPALPSLVSFFPIALGEYQATGEVSDLPSDDGFNALTRVYRNTSNEEISIRFVDRGDPLAPRNTVLGLGIFRILGSIDEDAPKTQITVQGYSGQSLDLSGDRKLRVPLKSGLVVEVKGREKRSEFLMQVLAALDLAHLDSESSRGR